MSARKNPAAVALGRMARGKPKRYSTDEIRLRTERLNLYRARRWPAKPPEAPAATKL